MLNQKEKEGLFEKIMNLVDFVENFHDARKRRLAYYFLFTYFKKKYEEEALV